MPLDLYLRPPAFWYGPPRLAARLLAPLGRAYGERVAARMARPGSRASVPVLCVGNFTLGGAGKTPLAMAIAEILALSGERPAYSAELPLPVGERVGVRGNRAFDSHLPPHPTRFARRPLPPGER